MKKLWNLALIGAFAAGLFAMTSVAYATSNEKNGIFQDVRDGSSDARDTVGTGDFGFTNSNQDADGNLRFAADLKSAAPNTVYYWNLYCGPTHTIFGNLIADGMVTTNRQGNASTGTMSISAATLSSLCGSGPGVGHMDFDRMGTTGTYVAAGIHYTAR